MLYFVASETIPGVWDLGGTSYAVLENITLGEIKERVQRIARESDERVALEIHPLFEDEYVLNYPNS